MVKLPVITFTPCKNFIFPLSKPVCHMNKCIFQLRCILYLPFLNSCKIRYKVIKDTKLRMYILA